MKIYRFKTEEEFKAENNWVGSEESGCPRGWCNSMITYLGKTIPPGEIKNSYLDAEGKIKSSSFKLKGPSWHFNLRDVIEEDIPKRVYKEDWYYYKPDSCILGVEMKNGNKYYLAPNGYGFIPINLKFQENTGYSDREDLEKAMDEISALQGNKRVYIFPTMKELIAWATS